MYIKKHIYIYHAIQEYQQLPFLLTFSPLGATSRFEPGGSS